MEEKQMDGRMIFDVCSVSEAAAISAATLRGRGDSHGADELAVKAMRERLNNLPIRGRVVIGEGERDKAPMLYIGEEVGTGQGPDMDIALDPLEGTSVCAAFGHNSLAVIAFAPKGGLLNAPDVYMEKLVCPAEGLPDELISLEQTPQENLHAFARFKKCDVRDLTVCVLDRPRHEEMIARIRETGARLKLIGDVDIVAAIEAANPSGETDIYMGSGGAPEGVLSAAALQALGGFMQGRLIIRNSQEAERAKKWAIEDTDKIYDKNDLAACDVIFSATGVTDGSLLKGVRFSDNMVETQSLVLQAPEQKSLHITSRHPLEK